MNICSKNAAFNSTGRIIQHVSLSITNWGRFQRCQISLPICVPCWGRPSPTFSFTIHQAENMQEICTAEKWGINKCTVISNENTKQKKTFGYSWQDYSIPREKFMFRNQQGIENDSIRVNKNTWFLRHQGNVITEWSVSRSLNSKQSPPFILFYKVWSWFNKPPLGTR